MQFNLNDQVHCFNYSIILFHQNPSPRRLHNQMGPFTWTSYFCRINVKFVTEYYHSLLHSNVESSFFSFCLLVAFFVYLLAVLACQSCSINLCKLKQEMVQLMTCTCNSSLISLRQTDLTTSVLWCKKRRGSLFHGSRDLTGSHPVGGLGSESSSNFC